jgi:hypothetical protein
MKNCLVFLSLLILLIFVSGCISKEEKVSSNVGLSAVLTSDAKKIVTSSPLTFILTVKNLASEPARDISAHLTNLTGWKIENELQQLQELKPSDLYKFSWVAYAPLQNKTFISVANVFYNMQTKANLKIRVYDNEYLESLKQDEREKIKSKSALLSSITSKKTPVGLHVSLEQPFILTKYSQKFPFTIEIRNNGLGKVYSDTSTYPPQSSKEEYVRFNYESNATLMCDFDDNALVKLENGNRNIVCRLLVIKDDVNKYSDFFINFTVSYAYLDKASTKIEVV